LSNSFTRMVMISSTRFKYSVGCPSIQRIFAERASRGRRSSVLVVLFRPCPGALRARTVRTPGRSSLESTSSALALTRVASQ
jgi:hypothetical protein